MMTVLIAVGVVAVCGAVGILGYFTHRFIYLLQTEVNCMKRVVARRRRKVERINREIGAEE